MRMVVTIRTLILASLLGLGLSLATAAQSPELATNQETDLASSKAFELSIRPILITHCISCHGPERSEGELRLDGREHFLRGGESGALVATPWEESLLIQAVRCQGPEMPPNGPLPDEKLVAIEQWVRDGAVWPEYAESILPTTAEPKQFTDTDRSYWLFQPHQQVAPPRSDRSHPIDAFVDERLTDIGLQIGEAAEPSTLARRAYLDLVGMPPTWSELQSYLEDEPSSRYEKLIERLLDDRRYGERWGRYWLDLVRFAESDGFKQDSFRPTAYRYRDYVIQSLNSNKPYSQFVTEQLAGDELDQDSDEMNAATGYLRHWIYEYNQRDVRSQWDNILNDLTDVTGELFLGLGFSCARCHDHKFDPLLQSDYYRLQAFFAPLEPRYDVPASREEHTAWQMAQDAWKQRAQSVLDRMGELESEVRRNTIEAAIEKFPPDVRPSLRKSPEERDPNERQIATLAYLQIENELNGLDFAKKLKGDAAEEWKQLKEQLVELKKTAPKPADKALTVRDIGPNPPQTFIPGRAALGAIDPGVPSVLVAFGSDSGNVDGIAAFETRTAHSTGRRLRLAQWITHPDNPLAWRTIVNRVWQHHFGRGIVASASDMGRLAESPSHPELLDWLAQWFVESGGDFKKLHYLIMTSETYRQSAYPLQRTEGMVHDPENRFLWRYQPRRLDAEQIRDSILLVSGDYDSRMGGPSDAGDSDRRAIYQRVLRNAPHTMLAAFDAPDGSSSVAKRNHTTTSLQALWMTNADWPLKKAESLAGTLATRWNANDQDSVTTQELDNTDLDNTIVHAYRTVLLRSPSPVELDTARSFLEGSARDSDDRVPMTAWIDFCHALFNANEFLYVE